MVSFHLMGNIQFFRGPSNSKCNPDAGLRLNFILSFLFSFLLLPYFPLSLRDWVMSTAGTRGVPVCMCRWWSLSDGSAWVSWSRWQSPGPCPPPSSSCDHRGADEPAASRPGRQKQQTLFFSAGSFQKCFPSCDKTATFKTHPTLSLPHEMAESYFDWADVEAGATTSFTAKFSFHRCKNRLDCVFQHSISIQNVN